MSLPANQSTLLVTLATRAKFTCGIELAEELPEMARSSVYAALAALQRKGLLDARWDHQQSHPRRMVRISEAGRAVLAAEQARLRQLLGPANAVQA